MISEQLQIIVCHTCRACFSSFVWYSEVSSGSEDTKMCPWIDPLLNGAQRSRICKGVRQRVAGHADSSPPGRAQGDGVSCRGHPRQVEPLQALCTHGPCHGLCGSDTQCGECPSSLFLNCWIEGLEHVHDRCDRQYASCTRAERGLVCQGC